MSDRPDSPGAGEPALDGLDARLQAQRPLPAPAFRGALGRHLAARDPGYGHRPAHLWQQVAGYGLAGGALLALGLLQALGAL